MSPLIHNAAFREQGLDYRYSLKPVLPGTLEDAINLLREPEVIGANVTIPYKSHVMKYLDDNTTEAENIGAVNTIVKKDGNLVGKNTDAIGGVKALEEEYDGIELAEVTIIGAGGASKALSYNLAPKVKKLTILNRTKTKSSVLARYLMEKTKNRNVYGGGLEELQKHLEGTDILINATPVGMEPRTDRSPIPAEYLHKNLLVYELVYNPIETKLLRDAKQKGGRVLSGVKMLVYQGALAYEMWTGHKPPVDLMLKVVQEALGGDTT
jgi:shikimate dehydrogenase